MLLDRIEIKGYRRLSNVSTYVGRKTVALVGPNEAGKTSLLAALRLFDDDAPVDRRQFTRADRGTERGDREDVVVLWMALDKNQTKAIAKLPLVEAPRHYRWHKKVDGSRLYSIHPSPRITAEYRDAAAKRWAPLSEALRVELGDVSDEALAEFALDSAAVIAMFAGDDFDAEAVARMIERVDELEATGVLKKVQSLIDAFREFMRLAGPDANLQRIVRDALEIQNPSFAQFGDQERQLLEPDPLSRTP